MLSLVNVGQQDWGSFRCAIAFLSGRLEDRATIDWALRLKKTDMVIRSSLLYLMNSPEGQKISEPWQSAWRLIEESWSNPVVEEHTSTGVYDAQRRIRGGEKSGSLVNAIVTLVTPQLKIEPFSDLNRLYRKPPKHPKKIGDLFSAGLTSGKIIDPSLLEIGTLNDHSFLLSLAVALDTSVSSGLDIARRIGWDGEHRLWQLGQLHRVYYVPSDIRLAGEDEPDEFHHGIAPSVKLLHAVVSRLIDVGKSDAMQFVLRWKLINSPIHLRLWAAMSRDSMVTPANEVGALLLSLDDRRFWDLNDYPEIAELRAKRLKELDPHEQMIITKRIRKLPPRNQWPREADEEKIQSAQLYWAARELRRIEIAGTVLLNRDKAWLDAKINQFPDLAQMARLDDGFLNAPKGGLISPNPDNQYDLLAAEERLKALEAALSSAYQGWDDDPAKRARDWIRQAGNSLRLIGDLESIPDGGSAFLKIWDQLGWTHSPMVDQAENVAKHDLLAEASRVVSLLLRLSEVTIRQAIGGISYWLSAWGKQVVSLSEGPSVWLKVWPIAVEVTNLEQSVDEVIHLDTVGQVSDDHKAADLDTLNTPVGRLVGVFLAACPTVKPGDAPFSDNNIQRQMRDAIADSIGPAGLIVKYRLIEGFHYFLKADFEWTTANLVPPLLEDTDSARVLWRAVARRTRFFDELEVLGAKMAERANDLHLDRGTRGSLVFSLIIECLYSFHELRQPAVPYPRIQQMIRSLDDEVRASGLEAVQRFIRENSKPREGVQTPPSPEELFRSAAKPFFQKVWPQERSLVTPGVSRAIADLPATAQEAFVEAVGVIEPFLVPFECWSMSEYGLYGEKDDRPTLSSIDNPAKAAAFLQLLNLTIGIAEGSVVPHDLADALDQIRKTAPTLSESQVFRRLAAAARRP